MKRYQRQLNAPLTHVDPYATPPDCTTHHAGRREQEIRRAASNLASSHPPYPPRTLWECARRGARHAVPAGGAPADLNAR